MPKLQAVVFDMDGVLFDTERLCTICWEEVAKIQQIPNIEVPILECVGRNEHDTRQIMMNLYGPQFSYDDFKDEVRKLFYRKIEEDGMPVMKGVREILEYLKSNGYLIALASSSKKESVLHHLNSTELDGYFEALITGDMVVHGKPDPEIYSLACEALKIDPSNAIAIEDSYHGIISAKRAGMLPVMVPDMLPITDEMKKECYAICDSLLEVIALIKKMN